jgi:hypothetical protein
MYQCIKQARVIRDHKLSVVAFLANGPPLAQVDEVTSEDVKVEGHEQFAIRGVSAGVFVVQEHTASTHHFDIGKQEVRLRSRSSRSSATSRPSPPLPPT